MPQEHRKSYLERVPCPSCTSRGPVWLDAMKTCVYCGTTWRSETNDIWDIVPWEWWVGLKLIEISMVPAVLVEEQERGFEDDCPF